MHSRWQKKGKERNAQNQRKLEYELSKIAGLKITTDFISPEIFPQVDDTIRSEEFVPEKQEKTTVFKNFKKWISTLHRK